jgi:RND family efflux transporter MFP subunit
MSAPVSTRLVPALAPAAKALNCTANIATQHASLAAQQGRPRRCDTRPARSHAMGGPRAGVMRLDDIQRPTGARVKRLAGALAFVLASAAVAMLSGCRSGSAQAEPEPRPVRVEPVRPAPADPAVRYSANVVPQTQVPLAFKVSGYIAEILQRPGTDRRLRDVQQGDVVTEGTVLARVSQADYAARVEQARAGIAGAEAALTKARADFDRASRLFDVQSLTKPDLDAARAARDSAESRLASARADATLAEIALRDCELKMPLRGVVLERRIERGALVSAGAVAFSVGNMRTVKALFGVPDVIAPLMKLGAPIPIRTDAIPNRDFPGRITAVSPAADPQSRVFSIEVSVPNQDLALRPGMVATVEVRHVSALSTTGAAPSPAPAIPLAAVVKQAQGSTDNRAGYAVFVVEDAGGKTIARSRTITLGDVSGNTVAVTSGLHVGERVIVSGATLVHDGDQVRIMP